ASEHRSNRRDRLLAAIGRGAGTIKRGQEASISPLRLTLRTVPGTPRPAERRFSTKIRDLSSLPEAMKRDERPTAAVTGTAQVAAWFEDEGDEIVPEIIGDQPQRESSEGHVDDVQAVRVDLRTRGVGQCF